MRTRWLAAVAVAAATLALPSCTGKVIPAVGESDDLVVVHDAGADLSRAAALELAAAPNQWLGGEPAFRATAVRASDLGDLRNNRHLLMVGIRGADGVERRARDVFGDRALADAPRLLLAYDGWAKGQVVAAVIADSDEELSAYLRRNSASIVERLRAASVSRLASSLRENGEARGLADDLAARYGWAVYPPPGYEFENAAEDSGLVFFRRIRPDRTLTVYWGKGGEQLVSRDFILAKKAELGRRYFDGDEIEWRRPMVVDTVDVAGLPAVAVSGWWANRELIGGGPFISYCLRDPETGIVYLVDVSLFAPGLEKVPLMRHMEAMALTFEPLTPE